MCCVFPLLVAMVGSLFQFGHGQVHTVQQEGVSLINGFATQGLVQLTYVGRTGLLCADGLSRESARVVCRDLGLPEQFPSLQPRHQPPSTDFLGVNVTCQGNEVKLADCHHNPWGHGSCVSGDAVYLVCKADPCKPSPCENGGTCVLMQTDVGFRCDCPPTWTGLLCTSDVNECHNQNGGCSDVCVNTDGGYSCECPARELQLGPDNHTCNAIGEEVTCGSDYMELTLDKVHYQSLHKEHLTLDDVNCQATDNATHIILRAPLTACGTKSQMVGTTIIYKNSVHSHEEVVDGIISRVKEVEIPFQCVMTLQEGIDVPINVDTGELHFLLEGTGTHDVDFQFSGSGEFQQGQGSTSVYPGQKIWGQASLNTSDPNLVVAISNCNATPDGPHNGTVTPYTVMTNGCAVDSTLFIVNTTDLTQQQFVMEAFKFVDNSPGVVFHCDVELCDQSDENSLCARGCANSH